ncbi:hypothetical protein CYMTET_55347 [Cymbomonas tetramitiformis]|uniref:Uncharacterized protein n=1 Tax=Cymbomonas tetramitiformis TaxID=36881 RepID=A0AAE0BE98_9CHLO|nr:hypothetical protein CYMTET_55347 [Cymbomonas tetramitiformis]
MTRAEIPAGTRLKVFWELDDPWYPGVVQGYNDDGCADLLYDDADFLDECTTGIARTSDLTVGDTVNKIKGFFQQAPRQRWRAELGAVEHTKLAVKMQENALQHVTKGNYEPKVEKFVLYCQQHGRDWLPTSTATVLLYLASILEADRIQATLLQPYLLAINGYHEDLGCETPARGQSVIRAVKAWLCSKRITTERMTPSTSEELRLLQAYVYTVFAFVMFGRPDTGVAMQREHISSTVDVLSVVLLREKGRESSPGADPLGGGQETPRIARDLAGTVGPDLQEARHFVISEGQCERPLLEADGRSGYFCGCLVC